MSQYHKGLAGLVGIDMYVYIYIGICLFIYIYVYRDSIIHTYSYHVNWYSGIYMDLLGKAFLPAPNQMPGIWIGYLKINSRV